MRVEHLAELDSHRGDHQKRDEGVQTDTQVYEQARQHDSRQPSESLPEPPVHLLVEENLASECEVPCHENEQQPDDVEGDRAPSVLDYLRQHVEEYGEREVEVRSLLLVVLQPEIEVDEGVLRDGREQDGEGGGDDRGGSASGTLQAQLRLGELEHRNEEYLVEDLHPEGERDGHPGDQSAEGGRVALDPNLQKGERDEAYAEREIEGEEGVGEAVESSALRGVIFGLIDEEGIDQEEAERFGEGFPSEGVEAIRQLPLHPADDDLLRQLKKLE